MPAKLGADKLPKACKDVVEQLQKMGLDISGDSISKLDKKQRNRELLNWEMSGWYLKVIYTNQKSFVFGLTTVVQTLEKSQRTSTIGIVSILTCVLFRIRNSRCLICVLNSNEQLIPNSASTLDWQNLMWENSMGIFEIILSRLSEMQTCRLCFTLFWKSKY